MLVRSSLLFFQHSKILPIGKLSFPYAEQSADMNFFGTSVNFAGDRKYSVCCDWSDYRHLICNGLTEPEALMFVEVMAPYFPAQVNSTDYVEAKMDSGGLTQKA